MNPLHTPIQIGGHTIRTEYDDTILKNSNLWGVYSSTESLIKIYPNLDDQNKTAVWLHELNEAIKMIWLDEEWEHKSLERHAQAMLQILPQFGVQVDWQDGK